MSKTGWSVSEDETVVPKVSAASRPPSCNNQSNPDLGAF